MEQGDKRILFMTEDDCRVQDRYHGLILILSTTDQLHTVCSPVVIDQVETDNVDIVC